MLRMKEVIIRGYFPLLNMGPLPLDELVVMVASFVMPVELIEEAVLCHHAPHPSCSSAIRRPGFCRAAIPSSDRPAVREASGRSVSDTNSKRPCQN